MNLNFDIIDSELKAYLIGLFYADAYLSDYVLQLRLSIKDKDFVEKLANIIGVKTQIKNVGTTKYQSIGFSICGKKIIDSLRKIGFVERKSYQRDDIVFRNIPDEWANFKSEIDALDFLKNVENPNYEIKKKEPKGYYRYKNHWLVFYKDENGNKKRKCFKTEKEAQIHAQNIKNKIKTYEKFIG